MIEFVRRFWKWIAALGVGAAVATPMALSSGGSIDVLVGSTPTPTATATPTPTPEPSVANLWVDTTGGTCTRQGTAGAYSDAGACSSFGAARDAASDGDTIRVKTGTYDRQGGIGHATESHTFIGEDGAIIDSGDGGTAYDTLSLSGNVTLDNVDVTGEMPIVQYEGDGNQWMNSRLDQYPDAIRGCNADEPLLLQDGGNGPSNAYTITNNVIGPNITVGQFKGWDGGVVPGCPDGYFHLEQARIGRGVDGLVFDRVTFEACPDGPDGVFVGCGSGHIFFTDCCGSDGSTSPAPPVDIVIKNSRFLGASPYATQAGANMGHDSNWTFAYNYFHNTPFDDDDGSNQTNITFVGNIGPRDQTCTSGWTFTKNVWQHSVGTACGTDTRVNGSNFDVDSLGIDEATGEPSGGSPVINAGETPGPSDYCTGSLASIDFEGSARPFGGSGNCDAGAYEVG